MMRSMLIGACAALAFAPAIARAAPEFAAEDARLKACIARDSSNMHIEACTSVVQTLVDARLNAVYRDWVEALKHPGPDDAKDDGVILQRLVAAERAWIDFRDKDCDLQSVSMLGGTGEAGGFGACRYAMTKARVKALEAVRASR